LSYPNLCRSCGCDFASDSAFDRHRVGVYMYTHAEGLELEPPREDGRRCLDADEMLAAGLAPDGRGRWSIVADVERARRPFAKAA
jgi:hypothetical protein